MARGAPQGGLDRAEFARRVMVTLGILLAAFLVAAFVWFGITIVFVLFAGILLANFLRGLATWLQRVLPLSKGWTVTIVILALLGIFGGLGWLFAPSLSEQAQELADRLPSAVRHVEEGVRGTAAGQWILAHAPDLDEALSSGTLVGGVLGAFKTTVGFVVNVLVILFLGLYFAYEPGPYLRGMLRLLPAGRRLRGEEILDAVGHQLRWWLVGRFASMAVVGALTAVGLWILGLPLALLLGLVAGLLSFVPILGPVASAVPGLLVGLLEGPEMVLWVLVVYAAVQLLESYFITPLIQQRAVSLPPVLIIMAQTILGLAIGLFGIALATPFTVTVVVLVKMLYVQDLLGDTVEAT